MSDDIAIELAAMKSLLSDILTDMRKMRGAITDLSTAHTQRTPPRESVVEEDIRRRIAVNEREQEAVMARSQELIGQHRRLIDELQHLQELRAGA